MVIWSEEEGKYVHADIGRLVKKHLSNTDIAEKRAEPSEKPKVIRHVLGDPGMPMNILEIMPWWL